MIPRVEINGGRKPRIVEYCIKKVLKPVVDFRESLFDRCFAIDGYLANRMLTMGYKFPSRFGRWCPVKVTQEPSQSALKSKCSKCSKPNTRPPVTRDSGFTPALWFTRNSTKLPVQCSVVYILKNLKKVISSRRIFSNP